MFCRNFGIPISRFFAFFPWGMAAILWLFVYFWGRVGGQNDRIMAILYHTGSAVHLLLFLPALAWFVFFLAVDLRDFRNENYRPTNISAWFVYAGLWFFSYVCLTWLLTRIDDWLLW